MTLMELKKAINKYLDQNEQGKKIKAKKIKKVIDHLATKEKRYEKELADNPSSKEQKKLENHLKITKAQTKKAKKLLKDLES